MVAFFLVVMVARVRIMAAALPTFVMCVRSCLCMWHTVLLGTVLSSMYIHTVYFYIVSASTYVRMCIPTVFIL